MRAREEALWEEARAAVLERRASTRAALAPDEALRFAVVPRWTVPLAVHLGLGPDVATAAALLETLTERGVAGSRRPIRGFLRSGRGEEATWWMEAGHRAEVLADCVADRSRGLDAVRSAVVEVAERVVGVEVPDVVRRWAELAHWVREPARLGEVLRERVVTEAESGRVDEALRWIEAGRILEGLIGRGLTAQVERAARRLELHHRHEADARMLARFHPRAAGDAALRALLEGPSNLWALHLIGQSGVGKTLLVRNLVAHGVPAMGGVAARVDFDHLNPDYPVRSPGLLLGQLAEELSIRAYDRATDTDLGRTGDEMLRVQEEVLAGTVEGLDTPGFSQLLGVFADLVDQLPRPVVLVLDTCEELARLRPDGTLPRAVQDTFTLFERLHEMVPHLRLVLSGRRLLAGSGAGWEARDPVDLPHRPYLRMHEVRGFTEEEARGYLARCSKQEDLPHAGRLVAPDVREALLAATRGEPDAYPVTWSGGGPEPGARHTPFELSLFASWAAEDPDFTLEALAAGRDRYVELRIVGRIRDPHLRTMLPAAALLGRFDERTLRATVPRDLVPDEAWPAAWGELLRQEWMQVGTGLHQVQPWRAHRMRRYFDDQEAARMEILRHRAVDALEARTREADLRGLDPDHFLVLLRLLEREPERAARWWDGVVRTLEEREAFAWLRTVASRALEEGVGPDHPLHARVLADLLGARVAEEGPAPSLAEGWRQVAALAPAHPLEAERRTLAVRGLAGLAAAAPEDHTLEALLEAAGPVEEATAPCLLMALSQATSRPDLPADLAARLAELARRLEPALTELPWQALGGLAAGRALLAAGDVSGGLEALGAALVASRRNGAPRSTLGWQCPADWSARVACGWLEQWPRHLGPEQALAGAGPRPRPPSGAGPAEDRLLAWHLRLIQARGPSPAELAFAADNLRVLLGGALETAPAEVPPAGLVALEILALSMDPKLPWLLESLDSLRSQALSRPHVAEACEALDLGLARTLRLLDLGRGRVSEDVAESAASRRLRWSLLGIASAGLGPDGTRGGLPTWLSRPARGAEHDRWRSLGQGEAVADDVEPFHPTPDDPRLLLDHVERALLRHRSIPGDVGARVSEWIEAHPGRPVAALRLALRSRTLGRGSHDEQIAQLAGRLGPVWAADVAVDEGELLALRLPALGAHLLEWAAERYQEARYAPGTLRAGIGLALVRARRDDLDGLERCVAPLLALLGDVVGEPLDSPLDGDRLHAEIAESLAGPWYHRLVACFAALHRRLGDETEAARLLGALASAWDGPPPAEVQAAVGEPEAETAVPELAPMGGSPSPAWGFAPELAPPASGPARPSPELAPPASGPARPSPGARLIRVVALGGAVALEWPSGDRSAPVSLEELASPSPAGLGGLPGPLDPDLVRLSLEPEHAEPPWERLIAAALGEGAFPHVERVVPSAPPLRPPAPVRRLVGFVQDLEQSDQVQGGWQALSDGGTAIDVRPTDGGLLQWVSGADVVHLVGHPVGAARGDVALTFEAPSAPRVKGRSSSIWTAPQLSRSLEKSCQLCVLQAPPRPETGRRSRGDLAEIAMLRRLAALLSAGGVPRVLVLPPLPPDVVPQVIPSLGPILSPPSPDERPGEAVARVRRTVAAALGGLHEPLAVEVALDTCFYVHT